MPTTPGNNRASLADASENVPDKIRCCSESQVDHLLDDRPCGRDVPSCLACAMTLRVPMQWMPSVSAARRAGLSSRITVTAVPLAESSTASPMTALSPLPSLGSRGGGGEASRTFIHEYARGSGREYPCSRPTRSSASTSVGTRMVPKSSRRTSSASARNKYDSARYPRCAQPMSRRVSRSRSKS